MMVQKTQLQLCCVLQSDGDYMSPVEAMEDTESPPPQMWWLGGFPTAGLLMVLLWSIWAVAGKMEPLTHGVICRCDTRDSKRVATEQKKR